MFNPRKRLTLSARYDTVSGNFLTQLISSAAKFAQINSKPRNIIISIVDRSILCIYVYNMYIRSNVEK